MIRTARGAPVKPAGPGGVGGEEEEGGGEEGGEEGGGGLPVCPVLPPCCGCPVAFSGMMIGIVEIVFPSRSYRTL